MPPPTGMCCLSFIRTGNRPLFRPLGRRVVPSKNSTNTFGRLLKSSVIRSLTAVIPRSRNATASRKFLKRAGRSEMTEDDFLTKDMIWKMDYGERRLVKDALKVIIEMYDATIINEITVFVNNNPYNLEFYLLIGVLTDDNEVVDRIRMMIQACGGKLITHITKTNLFIAMETKGFNASHVHDIDVIDLTFSKGPIFWYADRETFNSTIGYDNKENKKLFLSHSSKDKVSIRKIAHFVNHIGLPAFLDEYDIDFGEIIIDEIQKGIDSSDAVIFWITQNFLESKWCSLEMSSFLSKVITEDLQIYAFCEKSLDISILPSFLRIRRLIIADLSNPEEAFREIVPSLRRSLNKKYGF